MISGMCCSCGKLTNTHVYFPIKVTFWQMLALGAQEGVLVAKRQTVLLGYPAPTEFLSTESVGRL